MSAADMRMQQPVSGVTSLPGGPATIEIIEQATHAKVASCQLVTTLLSPMVRRAYRVQLDNGRIVKVRYHWDEQRLLEIETHLTVLGIHHFPKVLARAGSVLVLEWVDGVPFAEVPSPLPLLRDCGRLLAWMHELPLALDKEPPLSPAKMAPRVCTHIAALRDWGLLSHAESVRLADMVRHGAPDRCSPCLIHGDYCGENLVITPTARIYSIDNEALDVGFAEWDLARALMRWRLSTEARRNLLAGYAEIRPLTSFEHNRLFWEVVSQVRSVAFRRRCRGPNIEPALRRLKQMAAKPRSYFKSAH
jgi:hypothetical protein